ncbi:DUF3500 domain-containing protein [Streptomyces rimosus]|uniref:DUF3500 domain-containing protein n=1 Tax=Streptomyces rimosus TaxID=1927 RepID=UPI0037909CF8
MTTTTASDDPYLKVLEAAQSFQASLGRRQRADLLHPHTFANARRWHTYPQWSLGRSGRLGVNLASLSGVQWEALTRLLEAALGTGPDRGADKVRQHIIADEYLRSTGMGDGYGRTGFRIAFLGEPTAEGRWQLQCGGHHLAVANTYEGGRLTGATPSFRAIEPCRPFSYQGRTYDPMGRKRQALRALLASLDPAQRRAAELPDRLDDLLLRPGRDWTFPTRREGTAVADFSAGQRALALDAIRAWVEDVDDTNAARILARYEAELDETTVAYAGSARLTGTGDSVRIDGPSVWIELRMDEPYSTTEPHPHSVWRDRHTDYGGLRP